jgi:hypothetical protein
MSDSLFLLGDDKILRRMSSTAFETEDIFQDLLARFPDLLTDADFGESTARRWILVGREAAVPDKEGGAGRWSLDHLFLDQDGVPTLVEIKRATDTRARREVVAQMLDYAANAVSWWRVEDIAQAFELNSQKSGSTAQARLATLLEVGEPDVEAFWRGVQANLSSGRIRMIFVADQIAPELERIVEFLNEQMNPATVVALELRPFASGTDRILAPRLIGVTSRATAKSVANPNVATSVEDWLSTACNEKYASLAQLKRFLDLTTSEGAISAVAGQSIAIDFPSTPENIRVGYIRPDGRTAISGWMLRKAGLFASDESRLELFNEFESLGFKLSHRGTKGEPFFNLPSIDDSTGWQKLQEFFSKLSRGLTNHS